MATRSTARTIRSRNPSSIAVRPATCPPALLRFNYAAYGAVVSTVKPYIGKSGWLEVSRLTVNSLETEEYLFFVARTDAGEAVDPEIVRKLLLLPATVYPLTEPNADLSELREGEIRAVLKRVEECNARFFDEEVIKLDHWSEDLKLGLEREIKDLAKAIREAKKLSTLAGSLADKLEAQKQVKGLESTRNKKRRELLDAQDEIDTQRDALIVGL
ncbi:MAG: hypothetical protein IT366_16240 [Candidatus Hydrogenedentes bacterium]|nr:hypothetical protein [Candidatus Hydrogenedentota bacterium]